ncbi:hypothetical protein GCM10023311_15100 [Flaviramulus aquimarinus]|uniref:Secretion system C-terminal sorting domain-containing protein n=1 Tax=Flaviramulus aquimarinus TaxID=1170456 RepID=A0ABP9F2W4_9FLAO
MRKITFLLSFLTFSIGFAQVTLEDFEGTTDVTPSNGLGSANIIANTTGSGTAGNVLEVISAASGQPWQQANVIMLNNTMDLTTDKTVSVDVYSMTAINILSRIEDQLFTPAAGFATSDAQHNGTGWETLSFDFTELPDGGTSANAEYSFIAFFPSWVGGAAGNNGVNNNWNDPVDGITFLVDNITAVAGTALPIPTCSDGIMNQDETGVDCGGVCSPCAVPPTVAAPAPPSRAAADVASIYTATGGPYANIAVDTYDTGWCPGTTTEIMVAGNATQQVTGLGCEGVEFISGRFDATTFTHFHIDIFTTSDTFDASFNVKFSNWNGGGGEANALEFSFTNASSPALPAVNPGTWISYDIPLSSFTEVTNGDRNDLVQFIITSNLGTVYYDNLYLHKNTTLGIEDDLKLAFNVFPNPSLSSWTVRTESINMSSIKVFDVLGKNVLSLTPNKTETVIDGSSLKSGLYFAQIKTDSGISSVKLIKK